MSFFIEKKKKKDLKALVHLLQWPGTPLFITYGINTQRFTDVTMETCPVRNSCTFQNITGMKDEKTQIGNTKPQNAPED